jgi:hypothetical protein
LIEKVRALDMDDVRRSIEAHEQQARQASETEVV